MNAVLAVSLISFFVNIPLGYFREGSRKFSVAWFVWIHLSVPFIIALRIWLGTPTIWIPFFIALAIGGQFVGGRLRGKKR